MKILFLHGWNSVPGGVKPTFLASHNHEVFNPALPDEDFEAAVQIAQAEFDKHLPDVVVGSSRGGSVAMNIDSGEARLVLLCPAWKRWGTAKTVSADTVILHSRADDVIPFTDSEELVRNSELPWWTLIEVGHDHRLADPESLETMLEACLVDDEEDEAPAPDDSLEDDEEALLQHDWTGLCYTAVLRWVRASASQDWVVVHGTVWSEKVGKRIDHAWSESAGVVVDLALPVGTRIVKREQHYRVAQPQVQKVYSADDARFLAIKNRHDGPWDGSEQLNG